MPNEEASLIYGWVRKRNQRWGSLEVVGRDRHAVERGHRTCLFAGNSLRG